MTEEFTQEEKSQSKDVWWITAVVVITSIATFLRFAWLQLKPLHHDEGVNGHFLTILFREGIYKYDPSNYHGPDLYYISLAFSKVFGLNTLSVRSSVAIFGVLTVVLAFFLRRYIGKVGSLTAALFLALSPGMVYISRYFIHEILFVFFSLAIVVAILFFIEKRKAGIWAIAGMVLILMVCFLPTSLTLASKIGGENAVLLWSLRILIFVVEAVLVFFVMSALLAWDNGRPIYLLLASASTVLLFATKETAFITIGTMLIACACVWLWQKIMSSSLFSENRFLTLMTSQIIILAIISGLAFSFRHRVESFYSWMWVTFAGGDVPNQAFLFYGILMLGIVALIAYLVFFLDTKRDGSGSESSTLFEPRCEDFYAGLGQGKHRALILIVSGLVFVYIGVLFFSSFFTYPDGVKGAFEAYAIWSKTGSTDHTQNGTVAYLKWLMHVESPILILSALGTLIALIKARHRFAIFTAFWAFGLLLAYTIIPYKTPWLALSFTLPMCVIAGYGINELANSRNVLQKVIAGILGIASIGILTFQTYDLNFERYDSDRMPYVYAHSERGFLELINEIERYAEKSGRGTGVTIEIVSPDYWPMPWYLNDYPKANFHGKLVDANAAEMVVASEKQLDELDERYGAHYRHDGTYPLRPGVKLYLLVKKGLADSNSIGVDEIRVSE
ncbi:MAG: TIGR03663 family protein [Pyrinomonadaceae bacterium]|nr:TIGR03663 family protein [Pyrinomonadaceae bacterium]